MGGKKVVYGGNENLCMRKREFVYEEKSYLWQRIIEGEKGCQ